MRPRRRGTNTEVEGPRREGPRGVVAVPEGDENLGLEKEGEPAGAGGHMHHDTNDGKMSQFYTMRIQTLIDLLLQPNNVL